jgi:transcription initiation factor IIE alpha subunit
MSEQDILTDDLTQDNSVEGGQPAASLQDEKSPVLEKLNATLGKNFSSEEEALKAVKDTVSYVGAKKERIVEELKSQVNLTNSEVDKRIQQLEEANFFAINSEYNTPEVRALLKDLSGGTKPLAEVANSESFKAIYEKVKIGDEIAKSKSVLQSNPRLGKATTSIDEARDAHLKGDSATAQAKAVSSVIEAFEL